MRTGITSLARATVVLAAAVVCSGTANADPSQDDRFLDLLDQQGIPAVEGIPELIGRAHSICAELDSGTPFSAILDQQMNTSYDDNPTLRLVPGRVSRTSTKFIIAAVGAYCRGNRDKLP